MKSALFVVTALAAAAASAADAVSIAPEEVWSGVLSGQEVTFHYVVRAPDGFRGRLGWTLSVDERPIARGETLLAIRGDAGERTAISAKVPEVREGLVLDARLSLALYESNGSALASLDRTVRIFSGDPFAGRRQRLKDLKIVLFDPADKTVEVLEQAKVPFERVHNPAALGNLRGGVLVVGQGTSFLEYRALPETMFRLAAEGVPVICLAPSAGTFPVPGMGTADIPAPQSVALRRQEAITALDKRLDARGWPPDGKLVASTVAILAERQGVVGRVGDEAGAWPWIEVHYPPKSGTLLICGFGIIDRWEAGPAPRWLFARMLESVAEPTPQSTTTTQEPNGGTRDD